jgi:uncharacterized DUF497 family protein
LRRIEFDPAKDTTNRAKHGVSLADAALLDWSVALVRVDDRSDYRETRLVALAPASDVLFFVAFVDRSDARRIISLRKANRREVDHYVRHVQGPRDPDAEHR